MTETSYEELKIVLSDGYEAYARYWAAAEPKGAVLYHHGIQSHCGWYESSPARLAQTGFSVLQMDRRGSGKNLTDRGQAESGEILIADAQTGRDELFKRTGMDSYHVVGVSWGGKLAVAAYIAHPESVESLSLVTPGLFPKIGVSKEQMAKIGMAMIYDRDKLFDIPLNDPELFTKAPKWQDFFRNDELTLRQCSASFYLASRRMDKPIAKLVKSSPVPIHLFVAGDERIVDNEKTIRFIKELNWPGSRITTYDTARHSLEFENDPEIYFRDLVAFITEYNQSC